MCSGTMRTKKFIMNWNVVNYTRSVVINGGKERVNRAWCIGGGGDQIFGYKLT